MQWQAEVKLRLSWK